MTKRTKIISVLAAATLFAGGMASVATAQSGEVRSAMSQGIVGETHTGYLGFAQSPGGELRALVDEINIGRRSAYARLAQERGVTRQQVAEETACNLLERIRVGEPYQLRDGVWRTRGNAAIARPDYC